MTKSTRYLMRTENSGFYQGVDANHGPAFSKIKPISYYVMSFKDEQELHDLIVVDEFEKQFGTITLEEVTVEKSEILNERYISVIYLSKYGVKNIDAMFNILPIKGEC